MQIDIANLQRKNSELNNEREKIIRDLNQATTVKTRMENVTKDLQDKNREIVEKANRIKDEEGKRREDMQNHQKKYFEDIQEKIQAQTKTLEAKNKENDHLKDKMSELIDNYKKREQQWEKKLEEARKGDKNSQHDMRGTLQI